MKNIKINEAAAGMVLARDVRSNCGKTLLQKGTALSADNIKSLNNRDVTQIMVEEAGDSREFSEAELENSKEMYQDVVSQRFMDHKSDTMTEALFRAVLEHTAKRVLTGQTWTQTQ